MKQPRLLADRYRFHRTLPETSRLAVTWLALDEHTDRNIVASLLPFSRVATMRNALGFIHERHTSIVDIVHDPSTEEIPGFPASTADSAVVVAEWFPGRTLAEHLGGAPMPAFEAVQCVAKICSVVAGLHERGAVHGGLSARAVLVWRSDHGPLPLVTQLVAPPSGGCFSPERVSGGNPCAADDAWALHAVLFNALTGTPPFYGGTRQALADNILACAPLPLSSFGVDDTDLAHLLTKGLARDLGERRVEVDELLADLTLWLTRSTLRVKSEKTAGSSCADIAPIAASESARTLPEARPAFTGYYAHRASDQPAAPPEPAVELAILHQPHDPVVPSSPPAPAPAPAKHASEPPAVASAAAPTVQASEPPAVASQDVASSEAQAPSIQPSRLAPSEPPGDNSLPPALVAVRSRRSSHLPLAVIAGAAVLLGVWAWFARSGPAQDANRPPENAATAPAPSAPASSEVAASHSAPEPQATPAPSPQSAPAVDVNACAAAYFPADTFRVLQDLTFVCEEKDVRRGTARMRAAIVRGGRAALTAGMDEWGKLGWYELAVYGIVRWGCCHAEPVVEAPDSPAPCDSLAMPIAALAKAVDSRVDADLRVLGFEKVVLCVFNSHNIPRPYPYEWGPYSGSQTVFAKFLQRVPAHR